MLAFARPPQSKATNKASAASAAALYVQRCLLSFITIPKREPRGRRMKRRPAKTHTKRLPSSFHVLALEFDSKTGRESEGCVLCLLFPSEIRAHPRFPPPSPLLPLDQKKGYSILQRSPLALVPELFRRRRGRLTAVNLLPPPPPTHIHFPPFLASAPL